ncbi:MAG: class I adenylate-forming enzyme family protein [Pseudochelatococcus sp.]|jgi:long-chain acyl-CoA synthetase|uniref:class I adenylate-forming enzyme family protein n=1 Tax=Pseudochelatococcus sp. TaxID=2020869 RepID=UPI003D8B3E49
MSRKSEETDVNQSSISQESAGLTAAVSGFAELVRHWASVDPGRTAVEHDGAVCSYGSLDAAADRVADVLRSRGFRQNDRLFIVGENTIGTLILALACNRLEGCASIVNARMAVAEIRTLAAFADPRLCAVASGGSASAGLYADEVCTETVHDELGGEIRLSPVRAESEPNPAAADRRGDIGLIMFTSGTTGTPKGVMLTNATLLAQAQAQCAARSLTGEDRLYLISPLSHSVGFASNLLATFAAGAMVTIRVRFSVAHLVESLLAGRVSVLITVPQVYTQILDYAEQHGLAFPPDCLRVAGCGGASLDPDVKARVKEKFGLILGNGYGATELVPIARVPENLDVESNVVGAVHPDVDLRIVDDEGRDVPAGEAGEIWARGPFLMAGYFRNSEATAEVMRPGGWLATGDIGKLTADGLLAIVGRKKEIIIRSGFNVYPADVEAALTSHPDVAVAAVVGRAVQGNEEIVAFVQPFAGRHPDPEAVRAHLRETLTPYKVPSEIVVLDELPVGPTGKILKSALKKFIG